MLSSGKAGQVHGGDRLPWVSGAAMDNYRSLRHMGWQVHVYGEAGKTLRQWCDSRGMPIHEFAWRAEYGAHGLARDAVYLLRPDTYVALADESGSAQAIGQYFAQCGLVP
jgi:hypothetical protein